ncbi:YeeE/YedE family protein [Elioraea sp.]|uniref:YeeE/YedE family protein n=1 Tax=Elioraea sp. TaxID=2185103 RepID=UPI0025C00F40|nr:YeeE/YedE family protein [Elioraea sp.]
MPGLSVRLSATAWAVLLAAAALWLADAHGWRQGALWLIGAGLGAALLHAGFGFAGGFRALLAERRGAGFRGQLLLIGLTVALFAPVLAAGEAFGQPVRGFVFPVGVALVLGAFLFGIGMQLGGGCGSGTLYTAGGGSPRMWLTLAAFIAGATLAAWQSELWNGWSALPPVSLGDALTPWGAAVTSAAILAAMWAVSARLERARHGSVAPIGGRGSIAFGPWPLAWGAIALALLSLATLVVAGRPWAITAAFPLWGSQLVETLGVDDPAFWPYWEDPTRAEALLRPLSADRITVMDLGVMAGAAFAACLAARRTTLTLPRPGEAAGSIVGGLLLGVGATLGMGCNISAYLGGIASGSLHGWVWIAPALAGNAVGVGLRPLFGLSPRFPA